MDPFHDEYLLCRSPEDPLKSCGVYASRFPRFIARRVSVDRLNCFKTSVPINATEYLEFASWIDIPRKEDEIDLALRLDIATQLLDLGENQRASV